MAVLLSMCPVNDLPLVHLPAQFDHCLSNPNDINYLTTTTYIIVMFEKMMKN